MLPPERKQPVVFIAFEDFDNLGIGYLAAVLQQAGFETRVIDIRRPREEVLDALRIINPVITGFSVIFQYYINEFKDLIRFLREEGINCHFTAGGNYASLKYRELFSVIPGLDSIVRFEGEYILRELAEKIQSGGDWRKIKGIAFYDREEIKCNPLRPPEPDLDVYPFPLRPPGKIYAFDRFYSTLVAGRGCVHNCSFCNQNKFYRQPGWPLKRTRKPQEIVKEMRMLYHDTNSSVFLFEDDDFPVNNREDDGWIETFCNALKDSGLNEKIMWKINCRTDDITEAKFRLMRDSGLFLVFSGIEDGTDTGLRNLNKNLTVSKVTGGLQILKSLGIGFDYGFILFQPDTTFRSLNENLDFLQKTFNDGYSPVSFLRMMPYYETRVEQDLIRQNRLTGEPGFRTYEFPEAPLNDYYNLIADVFDEWLNDNNGLVNLIKWARNYVAVCSRFICSGTEILNITGYLRNITSESNRFLLESMKDLSPLFESGNHLSHDDELTSLRKRVASTHKYFKDQIDKSMFKLQLLSCEHQPGLMKKIFT